MTVVDFSWVLIGFGRRREIRSRGQLGAAGNGSEFAKTLISKQLKNLSEIDDVDLFEVSKGEPLFSFHWF